MDGSITSISTATEQQGVHVVEAKLTDGTVVRLALDVEIGQAAIIAMQQAYIERVYAQSQVAYGSVDPNLKLTELSVRDFRAGTLNRLTNLCVRTVELGWIVLKAEAPALQHAKKLIDEILLERSDPQQTTH